MKNPIPEIQLKYTPAFAKNERLKISNSQGAYDSFLNTWDMDTIELCEEFKMILLNTSNEVLGIHTISKGGLSATVVDLKLLFAVVLKTAASSIILAHNHPSGKLKPSSNDLRMQVRIKMVARHLDVALFDNIIITKYGFYSFVND